MRLRGPWLESSRGGTRTPDPLTRNRPACVLGSRKLSGWRAGNPDENPETGPNRTLPTVPTPYPAKKSVTREVCASRDSNAGPSAPEAAPASDHQRWLVSFQALTRVARRPGPASDGPVVTTVVTAGHRCLGAAAPPTRASRGAPDQLANLDKVPVGVASLVGRVGDAFGVGPPAGDRKRGTRGRRFSTAGEHQPRERARSQDMASYPGCTDREP